MKKSLTALGAFIFAGGFTLGVKKHFNVLCHLEETDYGVMVMRQNQPDIPVYVGRETWPLEDLFSKKIDFVYGNPPCAAWSRAGRAMTKRTSATKDWRTDARVNCTRQHFELLEVLRPRAWAWESVQQAFTKGRVLVDDLTLRAVNLGYDVTYLLHDARWLGVPQRRPRFFFVATQFAFDVDLAAATQPEIACDEALRGLNDPGRPVEYYLSHYRAWLHQVIPGEDARRAWERLNPPETRQYHKNGFVVGRPPFTIKRPRPGQPANTVMHEMIHPIEHRGLSTKELALLCGYPTTYKFPSKMGDHSLIARGVCPPVGEWLAREVARNARRSAPATGRVQTIDVRPTKRIMATATRRSTSAHDVTAIPRAPIERRVAMPPVDAPTPLIQEGSGNYICRLIELGCWSDPEIVALVHAHYPNRRTTCSDVSYNRIRNRQSGRATTRVPTPPGLVAPRPWETAS